MVHRERMEKRYALVRGYEGVGGLLDGKTSEQVPGLRYVRGSDRR